MPVYKHTQIGYLMVVILLVVLGMFSWIRFTALAEPVSYDSGTNLFVSLIMALILFTLASFATLTVAIDDKYLRVKFGYGLFKKKFLLNEVVSASTVKNRWYYGWGIRLWLWPKIWIYNISGFDAVEITMKNGKIYRLGTDDPAGLETAINKSIHA